MEKSPGVFAIPDNQQLNNLLPNGKWIRSLHWLQLKQADSLSAGSLFSYAQMAFSHLGCLSLAFGRSHRGKTKMWSLQLGGIDELGKIDVISFAANEVSKPGGSRRNVHLKTTRTSRSSLSMSQQQLFPVLKD